MRTVRLLLDGFSALVRHYPLVLVLLVASAELGLARMPGLPAHHRVLTESGCLLLGAAALGLAGVPRAARIEMRRLAGIREIDSMSGTELEERLAHTFRAGGWRVSLTPASGDFGADLVLEGDRRVVVQAKRHQEHVGVEAVQQAAAARSHYDADDALVVTNNYFTPAAVELAGSNDVVLWDRPVLIDLLARQAAVSPPRTGLSLAVRQVTSGVRLVLVVLGGICSVALGLVIACAARRSVRRVVSGHA